MELFGLFLILYVVYRLLSWFSPVHPFTSSSGFWTGFWTYVWSTKGFRRSVVILLVLAMMMTSLMLVRIL